MTRVVTLDIYFDIVTNYLKMLMLKNLMSNLI